ncbi:hypothetical protein NXZ75_21930 [Lysinibacillus sphaericus]|uniref:hypothetical protein n=1 Tax=Lysinibacillus sphaericus TaxID=1421 RepID=UPI002163C808|nr:hypothetical protein [Lysinibacillus sphaericus]MCS1384818.1 hypothetical protein [Lysinibacillus sphaericus]
MACELWLSGSVYMLYVDAEYKEVLNGIKRYRDWKVAASYQNGALQYRVPKKQYAKARRIEKRINAI